ncbi:hypothetical protein MAR_ORF136 [Marseillevirus marseillevirus]|uniref:Uncharacterized protein n=1 Tax=Marseillevirus marseillevirus TaxID=694581 RepID=D2XAE0_GBMV|nr:hypothetical protein MAR_ORF136 [Marseillevirus marseillevirus]ADB03917.1 hypothetical protein MAR_ORF136 [Marseillevirus marseillevirus]
MIRPQSASSSTEEVFFTAGIPPRKILETEPSRSKENSEKESLMEPFFFIETGLFRRVARSSKERRSKVLWTLSQRRQQYFVETRKRSTTSQGQENLEFLPLSFASRRKRFWVEKF